MSDMLKGVLEIVGSIVKSHREKKLKKEMSSNNETNKTLAETKSEASILKTESEASILKNNILEKKENEVEDKNSEKVSGNFDALPENYKTYITKISSKFPEPKKTQIINFGPIVIKEALSHNETKKLIPKIFAQINKESGRNPKALNDKGEYSIGFMQINKNAGHTGKINGKFYDLNKSEGNIAYGISFLADCIKRSKGNIRRGFNIYNGGANLRKPEKEQYAHSIINDKNFSDENLFA